MILFTLLFLASRAPHDIYELMKMFSVEYGVRADIMNRGMPYMSLETQMLLDALVFVPILLHPIIFILFNPEYREGFRYMWKNLYCNKSGSERSVPSVQKQKYRGNARPIIKGAEDRGEPATDGLTGRIWCQAPDSRWCLRCNRIPSYQPRGQTY